MTQDIFIPESSTEDALVSPLHTVTYVTADKIGIEKLFVEGMQLESSGWNTPSGEQRAQLNPYLGFEADDEWQSVQFFRSGELSNIQIRVICVDDQKPLVRPELNGLYIGGATIGFPIYNMQEREQQLAEMGVRSTVGVKELEFTNAAGETYTSAEIHFVGPENNFVLGVRRPDGFVPVGPYDAEQGVGAAAYSCRCVGNLDQVNSFCTDVLGYEVRRDMTMTVGARSGIILEEGLNERFSQSFAPGSGTGYLVFLEHDGKNISTPAPSYGPPNRGIVMWSFSTNDLDEVYRRAQEAGAEIVHTPQIMQSPGLPTTRTIIVNDPSGFPIEIFEA